MAVARKSDNPAVAKADALSVALRMHGVYHDPFSGRDIQWKVHRTPQGLALFGFIGVLGGMFGIGAGWANAPVLNLVMGVPLKVSIGTSSVILSIANSGAAWVYLNHGAMLAIIAAPSVRGMMLGSTIGVGLLSRTNVAVIRKVVIVLLLFGRRSSFTQRFRGVMQECRDDAAAATSAWKANGGGLHGVWKQGRTRLRARTRLRRQQAMRARNLRLKYATPEQLVVRRFARYRNPHRTLCLGGNVRPLRVWAHPQLKFRYPNYPPTGRWRPTNIRS